MAAGDGKNTGTGDAKSNVVLTEEEQRKLAMEMQEAMDDSLPTFLEFALAINKRDIQTTLRDVCRKLFDDASLPKEGRILRAEAVKILGSEFLKVAALAVNMNKSQKMNADDIKAQLSVAAMATMAKAQGQEMTEDDQAVMMKQAKEQMEYMQHNDADTKPTDTA